MASLSIPRPTRPILGVGRQGACTEEHEGRRRTPGHSYRASSYRDEVTCCTWETIHTSLRGYRVPFSLSTALQDILTTLSSWRGYGAMLAHTLALPRTSHFHKHMAAGPSDTHVYIIFPCSAVSRLNVQDKAVATSKGVPALSLSGPGHVVWRRHVSRLNELKNQNSPPWRLPPYVSLNHSVGPLDRMTTVLRKTNATFGPGFQTTCLPWKP